MQETIETYIKEIEIILFGALPQGAYQQIVIGKNLLGGTHYIKIRFASADVLINGVRGQLPDVVSLNLDVEDLELTTQVFGGNGGRTIYLKPNQDNPKEKYLAMVGHKLPFRKPKPNKAAILSAITKFAQEWVKFLKDNHENLYYQNHVDYKTLLNLQPS